MSSLEREPLGQGRGAAPGASSSKLIQHFIASGLSCLMLTDGVDDLVESPSGPHAIQIVLSKEDHTFDLDMRALKEVLLSDEVKNRKVVVVSVAGAFRKGKSFLLDYLLRYLNAQVKKFLKYLPSSDLSHPLSDLSLSPLLNRGWKGMKTGWEMKMNHWLASPGEVDLKETLQGF